MEGLIPFVIHAIKKSRTRAKYCSLSDDSRGGSGRVPRVDEMPNDGSSHHRRTRSEFHPPPVSALGYGVFSSDAAPRFGPSRSLVRDDDLRRIVADSYWRRAWRVRIRLFFQSQLHRICNLYFILCFLMKKSVLFIVTVFLSFVTSRQ